jgi:hypothetical protein
MFRPVSADISGFGGFFGHWFCADSRFFPTPMCADWRIDRRQAFGHNPPISPTIKPGLRNRNMNWA